MDRVYVANLPPDIRIKDIDDFFRPFGKLVYIDVNNRSNPVYAYVQFDSARNAFNAVKSRHGYDYEGYTLQLRLVENEVRKRRDATPPPPPPPMFNDRQNGGGFNNLGNNRMGGNFSNSSLQTNANSLWSNNDRSGMAQQQNMLQYPTTNRGNMSQQNTDYSNNRQQNMMQSTSGRSNMPQQYSNTNRSDMLQQYSNSNRSNMQQQYSNSNLKNMSQQNNYQNRSDISQQNLMYSSSSRSNMQQEYSNSNRSNMQQQQPMNMMDYSNNTSWNSDNNNSWNSGNNSSWNSGNNMNWNANNDGNNFNNARPNQIYNANNDPYAKAGFEDSYTSGLSGSGRKWFNRYIRQGLSPEMARAKALEHRTLPYLRDDPKNKSIANDPTNAALETIGNTIISLLATNPAGNIPPGFVNNMGGGKIDRPGPSTSFSAQTPRNAVSKRQYLRSVDTLKTLKNKREYTAKDRISKKYHTQIVRDYEHFQRNSRNSGGTATSRAVKNERPIISKVSEEKLEESLRKKKGELLRAAKSLRSDQEGRKRLGGAYKKRIRILIHDAGFSELEAKSLALHPLEKLGGLLALKKEYDLLSKKTDFMPGNKKSLNETPKLVVYRNDVKYLNMYKEHRLSNLSRRIITALNECIVRIHKYEKEQKLPLTGGKFVSMLQKIYLKQIEEKKATSEKKNVAQNKTPPAAKTTNKKKEEKKVNENTKVVNEKPKEKEKENVNNKDNENPTEDNKDNNNITEDNHDNENIVEDVQDDENIEEDEQDNENVADDDQEDQDITEEQYDGNEEELQDDENPEDPNDNEDGEGENE